MIFIDVDTAVIVPVNVLPLTDDTDFKTIETAVAYNAAGMALRFHFVTTGGSTSCTAVTPTSGGVYPWAHIGQGIYVIEIPASGGGGINNDTEGVGYFTGYATGVLPWRSPDICFRPARINKALITGEEFLSVDAHEQNFSVSGSNLTTKKPDGTTDTDYSPKTVTSDPAAEPITGAS